MKTKKEEENMFHDSLDGPNENEEVKESDPEEEYLDNDPDYLDNDPLEVVIEEEKNEQEELDTEDDLFDDDELDLDPTLDRDQW